MQISKRHPLPATKRHIPNSTIIQPCIASWFQEPRIGWECETSRRVAISGWVFENVEKTEM